MFALVFYPFYSTRSALTTPHTSADNRPGDEPPRHDSGPIEVLRGNHEGCAGDLASTGHIFPLVGLRSVQLQPERAGRGAAAGDEEPWPGDGQLLQ